MGKFVTMKAGERRFTTIVADDGTVSINVDEMVQFIQHCMENNHEISRDSVESIVEIPIKSIRRAEDDK